ncbi:MAG TPA: hypothetical protein VGN13_06285 [Solirubrobacteraceae bacterium]|jgi:hypothetical protein
MLAVIIPTVWLAVAMFFVTLCRMAARGDASETTRADAREGQRPPAFVTITSLTRLSQRDPASACRARPARRVYAPQRAAHGGRQHA